MEYWENPLEGRGVLFCDNIELQVDDNDGTGNISNPRKSANEWGMKPLSDFDKNMLNPNPKTIDDYIEFIGSDFPQIIMNSPSSDPSLGCLATEISDDSSKTVSSLLGELEIGSRVSTCVNKSSYQKSDLRLRGFSDFGEISNHKFSKGSPIPSSIPAKRARKENLYAPVYVCQVFGCNKDLSSSKEYYKRHKVCDVHSKASKVFVNGTEQRFCQQCSRFHFLAEFDDGKRSCRKRLAGHNERRRKPNVVTCSGKSYKLIQYSEDTLRCGHSKLEGPTYSTKGQPLNMVKSKSTVQDESSSISNSSSAPSLLSAKWQNLPSQLASNPMAVHHHQSSASGSYSSGTYYFDRLATHVVLNSGVSQSMEESINGGATVDMNQLSAHLQRVEQQKNFMLVMKPENDIFC